MEKQLLNNKVADDGGVIVQIAQRDDGFMIATKTERNRWGEESTNVIFVVSPNLYAMLEAAGYVCEPKDPWSELS